ncbi:MAG: hypothetical protein RLZZ303_3312 [Candidatus Hydrogenedentota bacterium]|jgi:prepilin-type N-terminal cleavage/methylation domain-containing protein
MNRRVSKSPGFTLIETLITVAILGGIFAITGTVMVRSAKAWRAQQAYAQVTGALRDATLAISQELEAAAAIDDSTLTPPIKGASIGADGRSISFHTPRSLDGKSWSNLVEIRLRNEDKNGDLKLSGKEDEDGNDYLDRVIERLEDLNGDGEFGGPGETRILARGIDRLSFAREEDSRKVTVLVEARYPDLGMQSRTLSEEQRFTVVIRN